MEKLNGWHLAVLDDYFIVHLIVVVVVFLLKASHHVIVNNSLFYERFLITAQAILFRVLKFSIKIEDWNIQVGNRLKRRPMLILSMSSSICIRLARDVVVSHRDVSQFGPDFSAFSGLTFKY